MRPLERTRASTLILVFVLGAVVGGAVQFGFTRQGTPTLVPPWSLPVTLVLLAPVLLVIGWRLRRLVRERPRAVNPFHAVRVLLTARAGALVGALLAGGGAGLWIVVVTRRVDVSVELWAPMAATVGSGMVLVVCALITESWCRIPPGNESEGDGEPDGPVDQAAYQRRTHTLDT